MRVTDKIKWVGRAVDLGLFLLFCYVVYARW
jgi:hypothetical protein